MGFPANADDLAKLAEERKDTDNNTTTAPEIEQPGSNDETE